MTRHDSENAKGSASVLEADPRPKTTLFIAGLVAGMVMTGVMLVLLLAGTTPRSIANLVSDKVAAIAGPGVSEFFIHLIGPLGKELLFVMVLVGQVLVGGLLGLLFGLLNRGNTDRRKIWINTFIISGGFWLVFVGLGLPLIDQGWFGAELGREQVITLLVSFGLFQLYGYVFGSSYLFLSELAGRSATSAASDKEIVSNISTRRRFVGLVGAGFVVLVGVVVGLKAFGKSSAEYWAKLGQPKSDGTLEGEVTPTEDFYLVSKNAFNPTVDAAGWKLTVEGLVDKNLSFDLPSLSKLPQKMVRHTLICISNRVGDQYIGNAEWTGVPLKTLLEQAGVKSGVKKVVFTCADGYKDSITIEKALEEDTVLALQMNGQPLTTDHGFPARMLVPNIYGMKNAKWLTSLTLIDTEFEGYWQKQGWNNQATIQTYSLITSPGDSEVLRAGQATTIRGVAYAGSRAIERVEVSTDKGQTWQVAQLKERAGPNTWTLWRLDWTPAAGGQDYNLSVRAVESGSIYQSSQPREPFPSGATGYHTIRVKSS